MVMLNVMAIAIAHTSFVMNINAVIVPTQPTVVSVIYNHWEHVIWIRVNIMSHDSGFIIGIAHVFL